MAKTLTTILTLEMDPEAQARFQALRQRHYPAKLNQIAAHLTLFHTLPATDEVRSVLSAAAAGTPPFTLQVSGVRSLGRGVAYTVESPQLMTLRSQLARAFEADLSAQDKQGFRPHVVVQNKVSPEEARGLLQELTAEFVAWEAQALGLAWWDYLGGPWRKRSLLEFQGAGV